jgi:antimicrobial peptide system SdpA family protein
MSGPGRLGAATLVIAAVWVGLTAYAVHGALPHNTVVLPGATALKSMVILPQGWKFFTRDPREATVRPVRRGPNGRWISASAGPHARVDSYFGLRRSARAQTAEMGLLAQKLPPSAWSECRDRPEECIERAMPHPAIANPSASATLCGSIALVRQPPLPWAWARSGATAAMPSTIARLEVTCSKR